MVDRVQEGKRSFEEMSKDRSEDASPSPQPMDIDEPNVESRLSLKDMLSRPAVFGNETGSLPCGEFEPMADATRNDFRVLVIGAGGLGCEILKDLAMLSSIITDVHVIDMDTIDVTNLNRQFLFRQGDVGKSKAKVAADFINRKCPWMTVTAHHCPIQDKDADFYKSFQCILSGLDNVEARRWLNATICGLVHVDSDGDPDPSTIVPMIDGGTEAFSGQARLILPRITSCFECSLEAFPPQQNFPLCTIADTPRRPEHCIAYASILEWPKHFDKKLDTDSPEDMKWVYERARQRAERYSIPGVTYMMTMGVVKNIIPAVASTNAIVSAVCVQEALKLLTYMSQSLNTYMMYMGAEGVYSHTFVYERKDDCPVCTASIQSRTLSSKMTLNELIQDLKDGHLRLEAPSLVSGSGTTLYMQKPVALETATRPNLDKALSTLIADGEELTVTDPILQNINLALRINFED